MTLTISLSNRVCTVTGAELLWLTAAPSNATKKDITLIRLTIRFARHRILFFLNLPVIQTRTHSQFIIIINYYHHYY